MFHERLDLTPRTNLPYVVEATTLRRQVEQRGWYVWDETRDSRSSSERASVARERRRLMQDPWPDPPATASAPFSETAPTSRAIAASAIVETPLNRVHTATKLEAPSERSLAPEKPAAAERSMPLERKVTPERPVREEASAPIERRSTTERPVASTLSERSFASDRPAAPERRVVTERPERRVAASRPEPVPPVRHQVVWFDIPVRDIDRALSFYSAVLGITLKKERAGPGAATAVLPHADGSIGGALVQSMDAKPSESGPLLYLNTNGRLDEALRTVERLGGKVLAEKHSIAPFGFRAIVLDSEGNRLALHSL